MKLIDLFWFIGTFIFIYLIYLFSYVIGSKKLNKDKIPLELMFLVRKYRLDLKKINYKKTMNFIGLICAFDISFTATFMFYYVKNLYLSILIGAIMLIPLIIITFNLIGKYYEKRGMIINGNEKN